MMKFLLCFWSMLIIYAAPAEFLKKAAAIYKTTLCRLWRKYSTHDAGKLRHLVVDLPEYLLPGIPRVRWLARTKIAAPRIDVQTTTTGIACVDR